MAIKYQQASCFRCQPPGGCPPARQVPVSLLACKAHSLHARGALSYQRPQNPVSCLIGFQKAVQACLPELPGRSLGSPAQPLGRQCFLWRQRQGMDNRTTAWTGGAHRPQGPMLVHGKPDFEARQTRHTLDSQSAALRSFSATDRRLFKEVHYMLYVRTADAATSVTYGLLLVN